MFFYKLKNNHPVRRGMLCVVSTVALFLTVLLLSPVYASAFLPTVSISYPPNGATLSGQTYVTISSNFNLPLTGSEKQQLYLDGNLLWSSSVGIHLVQPFRWDTATIAPGSHTLTATVRDAAGNTASSSPISINLSNGSGLDTTAPTVPANLIATMVGCDKVSLSWNIATDLNGSGVKSYTLYRTGYPFDSITLAADRNTFDDTDNVKSETTYTYYLLAEDFSGNISTASNSVTVTTPSCFLNSGEETFDNADMQPSGTKIAAYGSREAFVYQKLNKLSGRYDSYVQLKDEDTGAVSKFLLHSDEYETDYILTGPTTLLALAQTGSNLTVNEYRLNGSPIPTSATLVSTQSFGDTNSCPQFLSYLESGAVIAVWTAECGNWGSATFMQLNVAYRNPSGVWGNPITVSLSPDTWKERIAIAQHPVDGSVWVFNVSDTSGRIGVSHFTETLAGLTFDWNNPRFIAIRDASGGIQDGINGPGDEYPFLAAAPDPARNTIDLAYQRNDNVWVYIDPLFQNGNGIFMKQNSIAVAHIKADGTRVFNVSPAYTERVAYFGFSVLGDGTLWLSYFPIDHESLTWNQVYAAQYTDVGWSASALVGSDLNGIYNWSNSGPQWNPGFLISRVDLPKVVFRTPDGRIHSFNLEGAAPVQDTVPPTTPAGLVASGITNSSVALNWTASTDNIGVAGYNIYRCQGGGCTPLKIGSSSSTSFQDTGLASDAAYTYLAAAYDARNNVSALSYPVYVSTLSDVPTVTISSPSNGSKLKGTVSINSSAKDNSGIARIELYIDGILTSQSTSSSLSYKWSTSKTAVGSHSITSKAYDPKGNMGQSNITVYK